MVYPTGVMSTRYPMSTNRPTSAPRINRRAKKAKQRNWVFLPQELWDALDIATAFQVRVFELEGDPDTSALSRNDWIEDGLTWALAEYWIDKGLGEPKTKEEALQHAQEYVRRQTQGPTSKPKK